VIENILASAQQTWPPFALVAGLLLIGKVTAADGLFEALGARLAQARLGSRGLLIALLALVAVVTAVLNLDTSVVFLTPVLIHAARRRNLDERPFLYGSVFMANAASLLLPGSNLTNLLVLRGEQEGGAAFAAAMFPAWITACSVTALFLLLVFRLDPSRPYRGVRPPFQLRVGAAATLAAATVVVTLPNPALAVLAIGVAATALRRLRPRLEARALALLFGLSVELGTVARGWHGPGQLLASSGVWSAAAIAATASIVVNNLPAATLLSAQPAAHPHALLVGLDVGPDLAVTGSLAALLWLQSARTVNAQTSILTYSRLGLLLAPLTLIATLITFLR
jgi:arsenical pump membrane protein